MRRLAPRPISSALDAVVCDVEPAGLLARIQARWADAAGAVLGAATQPVAERDGVVTVRCESSLWAQELELLAPDLLLRLNGPPGSGERPRVERFRFVVGA